MRLFRNPRFSAASGAIALAFFGLFGFIFLITQYFQVVRDYSTLRAGVATLPFALVTGAVSPLAIVLMHKVGTKVIVTAGLLTMSAGFVVAATTGLDTAYWGRIVISMVLMAAGLALSVSPATESIMGSLPVSQAGAGSAVNDTVREVGGTLGVAVVGSTLSTVYGPRVVDGLTPLHLPAAALADGVRLGRGRHARGAGPARLGRCPGRAGGAAVLPRRRRRRVARRRRRLLRRRDGRAAVPAGPAPALSGDSQGRRRTEAAELSTV